MNVHNFTGSSQQVNDGNWHHIAVVYDRDGTGYYVIDGVYDWMAYTDISSWNGDTSTSDYLFLARRLIGLGGKYDYFDGTIDEVHISNMVRSNNWINTSYLNQKSPSTFYTVGSQTTRYFTIVVENTGNVNLKTSDFSILINGTAYPCSCNHSYLYPYHKVWFYTFTPIRIGQKQITVITGTKAEDEYIYVYGVGT
jgi:archaellum component FlaF (FlaF/FlaG flagellin family)